MEGLGEGGLRALEEEESNEEEEEGLESRDFSRVLVFHERSTDWGRRGDPKS